MATVTSILGKSVLPMRAAGNTTHSHYRRWGKRFFDIAASLAGLAISAPLLLICYAFVRLTSRGPVFFRQIRVGHQGQTFELIKFRTMVEGAEALGPSVEVKNDGRVTCVGRFLRRTKLDELPQLVNVLFGQMSLVGPRPRVPQEVDLDDPRERILLGVRPGVTSYASIHHRREADYCARQTNPQAVYRTRIIPQKRSLDCEYVQNLTLQLDLKLLLLTVLLVWVPERSLSGGPLVFGRELWPYGRGAQMLLDLTVYTGAAWVAYSLRFDAGYPEFYRRQMFLFLEFIPLSQVALNHCLGIYDRMWRYVTLGDASALAGVLAPVTLVLFGLRLELPTTSWLAVLFHVPFTVIVLDYAIALGAGLGLRGLRRMLYVLHHHYQPLAENARRILVVGAGLLGLTTAVDIRRYPHLSLLGFLDDDPAKDRRLLAGSRVLGSTANLETFCTLHRVTDVLICANSIDPARARVLQTRCAAVGAKLHHLPGLDQVLRQGIDSLLSSDWVPAPSLHPIAAPEYTTHLDYAGPAPSTFLPPVREFDGGIQPEG